MLKANSIRVNAVRFLNLFWRQKFSYIGKKILVYFD